MSSQTNCKVNSDGSVCLKEILNSFNSPIREEHAWALCYQFAKYFSGCLASRRRDLYIVKEVEHVYLQTDGNVHENTTKPLGDSRKLLQNESDIIGSIGVVIYTTLSQGTETGEERLISQDLESLISDMIPDDTSHHETDDEGIERDSEETDEAGPSKVSTQITLEEIITRCEVHLGTLTKNQVEAHYKAVVRAFVTEALELSMFLQKVEQGSISLPTNSAMNPNLTQLNFSDWAKFWVQVMSELRTGVKLKKVNYSKAPIEYELTPYEILMKDIRTCRYNLRKIMINGDVPSRVTKDAHAIILEFIRSRPPLRKASERKLPEQPQSFTPREKLLNSIRLGKKLRPTPSPRISRTLSSSESSKELTKPKKLIKVDFSQLEDFDDDDEVSESPDISEPGLWSSEYSQICATTDAALEPYDLAIQDVGSRTNVRRHTLGVLNSNLGCYSVPQSRPCSRQSCNSSEAESVQLEPEVAKLIQEGLIDMKKWEDSLSLEDRLSLTLSEIVHIRSVLTKAELDALPSEGRIRHDVEARKVCFLCLKTRFGIFGPWGQRCTLCKRTICSKCYSKMNIPMEHFSTVPVVLLSPSIMATPEDEMSNSFTRSLVVKMKEAEGILNKESPTASAGSEDDRECNMLDAKPTTASRAARVMNKLKTGNQMVVCHDCKRMVLQIIQSARVNRSAIRNKTIQNMTLNLSPVF
ncbi:protein spire [Coccinella septempunctata]|uniref:protein spire n=1 Tax=Coccinella septempunctata TaxID=41139 RepID=UPI001D075CD4|nr:protein spire [Coccinella septempunctata]